MKSHFLTHKSLPLGLVSASLYPWVMSKPPLASTHPDLALEAFGWDPKLFSYGSDRKVAWKCSLGHIWDTSISHRAINKSNCPICWGRTVLKGFNDLESKNPSLASEANGWDPSKVTASSSKKLPWRCSLGHIWEASVSHRTNMKSGCPYCAGKKVLVGFNDLATTDPELSKEAEGWDPRTLSRGTAIKRNWKCSVGHIWADSLNHRSRGDGCPICSSHQVLVGFNDLASTNPELIPFIDGWDPTTVTRATDKKRMWVCDEGHKWRTRISHRTNLLSGCPTCAKSGFDPNKPSYLYFLSHPHWEMFQIGITNDQDKRLGSHKKLGWEIVEVRGPMDGHLTQEWETSILRMLKAKGADLSNSSIVGKFDGYSEAWSKSTFPTDSIQALMRITEEHEQDQVSLKMNKKKAKK